jgi:choline dehydrogenase-like flavoprotein
LTYDFNRCSGTRAVGIEYVDDTLEEQRGTTEPLVARASHLVVPFAEAFGSPAIIERSGIGYFSVCIFLQFLQLHFLYSQ